MKKETSKEVINATVQNIFVICPGCGYNMSVSVCKSVYTYYCHSSVCKYYGKKFKIISPEYVQLERVKE